MKVITRTIWLLSLVSLFTDVASEMLYPIMPIYLKSINFSIVLIGVLEGIAEATAGLSKGYFGKLSDNQSLRVPFVRWGYLLSALSKPLMALFTFPLWIFGARTIDRFGKGIRTGARDAMLSDEATPETKGRVFGFHRSMDTLGAVIGPLSALAFLYFYPGQYKTLFFVAFVPGMLAIAFTFLLRDKNPTPKEHTLPTPFTGFLRYWNESPGAYKKLVAGLVMFTLFNSSDVFLLLKIKEAGQSDTTCIFIYVCYNLVYALASYPIGILADRLGLKKIFIVGLVLFTAVYAGMAVANSLYAFLGLFCIYGIYAAATEGIAKAWISNITNKKDTATAIGTYSSFQSIGAMVASSLAGLLWYKFGAAATFTATAVVTGLVVVYFMGLKGERK